MGPVTKGQKACNKDDWRQRKAGRMTIFPREEKANEVAEVEGLMLKRGRRSSRSRQEGDPAPSPLPQARGHATQQKIEIVKC